MTYTEDDVRKHPVWKHVASGVLYPVLGVAECSTNGEREHKERSVVYFSLKYQRLCYREVSQFLDGRFAPEEAAPAVVPHVARMPHTTAAPASPLDIMLPMAQRLANERLEDVYVILKPNEKLQATEHAPYMVLASQASVIERDAGNYAAIVKPERQVQP